MPLQGEGQVDGCPPVLEMQKKGFKKNTGLGSVLWRRPPQHSPRRSTAGEGILGPSFHHSCGSWHASC